VLSAVIVTAAVVSVTSMSAMLVRSSFQEGDLRARLTGMAEEQQRLAREVVTLSAPSRVATWARAEGMVIAEDVEVLHVRTGRPGA